MAMMLPLIVSCSPIQVNNTAPAPHFLGCKTTQDIIKCTDHAEKLDLLQSLTVMLQLRERQPKDERDEFGDCKPVSKPAK